MHQKLLDLHFKHHSGQAIHRELVRLFGERAPHPNTIYKEMRAYPRDGSAGWSLSDRTFTPEEARAVMAELHVVVEQSEGRITGFTQREAWWIARLRAVNPDFAERNSSGAAYWLARQYVAAEQRGEPTQDLDWQVFSPWPPIAPSREELQGHLEVRREINIAKEQE